MEWNVEASLAHLRRIRKPKPAPPYQCARHVHAALEAGGLRLPPIESRHPEDGPSACDYGRPLEQAGFAVFYDNLDEDLASTSYAPAGGDITIFMPITSEIVSEIAIHLHRHGHIQMYDDVSAAWISDFRQGDFFPDRDTRIGYDRFQIYRHAHASARAR